MPLWKRVAESYWPESSSTTRTTQGCFALLVRPRTDAPPPLVQSLWPLCTTGVRRQTPEWARRKQLLTSARRPGNWSMASEAHCPTRTETVLRGDLTFEPASTRLTRSEITRASLIVRRLGDPKCLP